MTQKLMLLLSSVLWILLLSCQGQPPTTNKEIILSKSSSTNKEIVFSKSPYFFDANIDRRLDTLGLDSVDIFIYINKKEYRLSLMIDSTIIISYHVVLGSNPMDDKRMQGDGCTPEGEFKIRAAYPHDSWSHFLWIDYPTAESRRRHVAAKADGIIPKSASIGGEIGIHGVPEGSQDIMTTGYNWTLGCISLSRQDVQEIYNYTKVGTRVLIVNH